MRLIIGNKNYSSWSLRAWLALKANGFVFEEILLPLDTPEFYQRIAELNPSGKVPALLDDELLVWDSLSIIDYLHHCFPKLGIWPELPIDFALAKSMSAEMHSGLHNLRAAMPMNIREKWDFFDFSETLQKDINRVQELWTQALTRKNNAGPFLFGTELTGADFMFAPVVARFRTYGVPLTDTCQAYADAVWQHPAMQEWISGALAETEIVDADEIDTTLKLLG